MKKIVLKMNDLNMRHGRYGKLEHASFFALEGEVSGLMGLDSSGNELVARILLGEAEIDFSANNVYIDGRKIRGPEERRKLVGHMAAAAPVIQNWTVAEYVGLRDISWFLSSRAKKQLHKEVTEQFTEIGVSLDIDKKMKELSELERRMVELVRARKAGVRVLVIEDECEGMNRDTIQAYKAFLKKAIEGRMAVLLLCHSELAASVLTDNYIIFRRGRVVKRWRRDSRYNNGRVNDYLLGNTMIRKKKTLDNYARKAHASEDVIYGVRNLELQGAWYDYDFRKGEITTFVILNNAERMRFFDALCGRSTPADTVYVLEGQRFQQPRYRVFMENRVVSFMKMGNDYEIFEKMSVGDNLLLPSLKKIPGVEYMSSGSRITRILSDEIENDSLRHRDVVKELDSNEHITIAFDRWYVFNPKVIVLYEPFAGCDAYGVSIIVSYIKKFSNRGTAVIVIKSSLEYMADISDRVFNFE